MAVSISVTDPDGSLAPGDVTLLSLADGALFSYDAVTQTVSGGPFDFEAPTDSNGDNVYMFAMEATDGTASTTQFYGVTISNANDSAPGFTSGTTAVVDENTAGTVYTATASDADGDAVAFSLSGTDAAAFRIDASSGAVSFIAAPDYELPTDAGGDNVYDMVVTASDGSNSADLAVTIGVTNVAGLGDFDLTAALGAKGASLVGEVANDRLGTGLANAGDVNGDGYNDLIISAPYHDTPYASAGKVYVLYGGAADFDTVDLSAPLGDAGFVITGAAASDQLGKSVSGAGDINGDGIDDVIVGASRNDDGGANAGKAYVIYGQAGDVPDVTLSPNIALGSAGFSIQGAAAGDKLGQVVSAAGDVNGDGVDDVIVGAANNGDGGVDAGKAYVIYGNILGVDDVTLSAHIDLMTTGFSVQGAYADDGLASTVAGAGDVNKDGFDDIVVGARRNDDGGMGAGKAYVIYGAAGDVADVALTAGLNAETDLGAAGFTVQGGSRGDHLGVSVSRAGDVNADGYDDVIVGAYVNDDGGSGAGKAYVIYGAAGDIADVDAASALGSAGFSVQGLRYDRLGLSVSAAGDINGDGFDDVLVGGDQETTSGGGPGIMHLIYGASGDVADVALVAGVSLGDAGITLSGAANRDNLGENGTGLGDINGDGLYDFAVAAVANDEAGNNAGKVYVIYGMSDERSSTGVAETGISSADLLTGSAQADTFTDIATGDVVRAGPGADSITVTSADFAKVDGGNGVDTLVLNGSFDLDLATLAGSALASLEVIDASSVTGLVEISLLPSDVTAMVGVEANAGGYTILRIETNSYVQLMLGTANWDIQQSAVSEGGQRYDVYTHRNIRIYVTEFTMSMVG